MKFTLLELFAGLVLALILMNAFLMYTGTPFWARMLAALALGMSWPMPRSFK